jgi:hypothetical protein
MNIVIFLRAAIVVSEINVNISSYGEQNVSSDEKKTSVTVARNMAYQQRFPFTGKPGLCVALECPSNPLEYFELLCTPEVAEVIARERTRYAQKC